MLAKRVKSWIIDYAIIVVPFLQISLLFDTFYYTISTSKHEKTFYIIYLCYMVLTLIAFLCKDVIGKRSLGKKKMGIIITNKYDQNPTFLQLFVRNLTFFIWPLEVIMVLWGKKRIGELISDTKLTTVTKGDAH